MHMMHMLGIIAVVFFAALFIMSFYRDKLQHEIINKLFIAVNTVFLNEKVKSYAHAGIAFLSFGMFLAMFISPEHEYLFNFRHEVRFIHVAEAACHLIMSLYGFYLILSKKVKLTLKNYFKSVIFMFVSVFYGVFLNWCFHLGNFGMNMYGGYSIYFIDIFNSFPATFAAYLFGILLVLTLGFLVGMGLDRLTKTETKEKESSDGGD